MTLPTIWIPCEGSGDGIEDIDCRCLTCGLRVFPDGEASMPWAHLRPDWYSMGVRDA